MERLKSTSKERMSRSTLLRSCAVIRILMRGLSSESAEDQVGRIVLYLKDSDKDKDELE